MYFILYIDKNSCHRHGGYTFEFLAQTKVDFEVHIVIFLNFLFKKKY